MLRPVARAPQSVIDLKIDEEIPLSVLGETPRRLGGTDRNVPAVGDCGLLIQGRRRGLGFQDVDGRLCACQQLHHK